jgi:hypothetical protein
MVKKCTDCGTENPASAVTCVECGSLFHAMIGGMRDESVDSPRRLLARDDAGTADGGSTAATAAHSHLPNASKPLPGGDVLDAALPDVPYQLVLLFVALGVMKVMIEIPLGVSIASAEQGKAGLSPITFAWQYLLGFGLLAAAVLAGLGAYSLYYLQNLGAAFLSASLVLDVLLLVWLIVYRQADGNSVWPGSGPYGALALVCGASSLFLGQLAFRRRLL